MVSIPFSVQRLWSDTTTKLTVFVHVKAQKLWTLASERHRDLPHTARQSLCPTPPCRSGWEGTATRAVVVPGETPFSWEQRWKSALELGVRLVDGGLLRASASGCIQRPWGLTSVKDPVVGTSESEVRMGLRWAPAHYCYFLNLFFNSHTVKCTLFLGGGVQFWQKHRVI